MFLHTLTEWFGPDEWTSFLHGSFGFLKSIFGPFFGCFYQLLHLWWNKIKKFYYTGKLTEQYKKQNPTTIQEFSWHSCLRKAEQKPC